MKSAAFSAGIAWALANPQATLKDKVEAATQYAEGALTKQQVDKLANEIMDLVQALCEKWTHGDASEVGCAKEAVEEAVFNLASFAAPAPKLVPVGSISKLHLKASQEPWCKEVLLYSPNNQGDYPKGRVQLFTLATTGEQA